MAQYVVEVKEELVRHFVVEADSPEDAENKVQDAHGDSKIVLDYDDYDGVYFDCIRKADENDIASYANVEDL